MKDTILPVGGNVLTYIIAFVQTNELFQIISFALSIITSVIIIAYKVWAWWKEAKKDGKITQDEIKQLGDSIGDDVKNLHDKTKGDK